MKRGIAGDNGPAERPTTGFFDQTGANGVGQDIKANFRESVSLSLFVTQNVIVGLMLKVMRVQGGCQVFAQELYALTLI